MATVVSIERDKILPYIRAFNEDLFNVISFGPPGTGKTSLGWAAARRGQQVFEVTCTSEQSAATLTGFFVPKGDHFEYLDGIAVRAWLGEPVRLFADPDDEFSEYEEIHMGGLLVINEIDKASPDMMDCLHVIADDPSVARLYLPDGRVVKPRQNFWCWATTNALPEDLPEPIQDRFPLMLPVWEPGEGQLNLLSEPTRVICKNLYSSVKGTGRSPQFTFRALRVFDNLVKQGSPVKLAASVIAKTGEAANSLTESYELEAKKHVAVKQPQPVPPSTNGKTPEGTLPDGVVNAVEDQTVTAGVAELGAVTVPSVSVRRTRI